MEERAASLTSIWLVRVRWVAFLGQSALVLLVSSMSSLSVPVLELHGVLLAGALSNIALWAWVKRGQIPAYLVPAVLALDTCLLTAGLHLSGGPMNPFSFLYVVHVALAALVVGGIWTWVILGLAVGGYALLYGLAAGDAHLHHSHAAMQLHLDGMWVAMAVSGAFIVFFLTRLRSALDQRELELASLREQQAQQDKLATLSTLAAGAAHELATPLSSIAIAAKELETCLGEQNNDLLAEATVVRTQTQRCQKILKRLSAQSGRIPGEPSALIKVATLVDNARALVLESERVDTHCGPGQILVPTELLAECIAAIIENGFDAGSERVQVRSRRGEESCIIAIEDTGRGMSLAVQKRATEPFFTTKEHDTAHMGLGLFLAQDLSSKLGGNLTIESSETGTIVTISLPCRENS